MTIKLKMKSVLDLENIRMFDPELLVGLETPKDERFADYFIRPLAKTDFADQYECLKQLTQIGEPTQEMFDERFDWMKESQCYYVIVVVEKSTESLVIFYKLTQT